MILQIFFKIYISWTVQRQIQLQPQPTTQYCAQSEIDLLNDA
jgi:hypothetical protein